MAASEITPEVMDLINTPGRIGILATASAESMPNAAYFGSPQLRQDGILIMGLGENRTLKNLEENPQAVFIALAKSPVEFSTPGFRLYLKVNELQRQGKELDHIRAQIEKRASKQAAQMIKAAVLFEVFEVRKLVAGLD